jgi:multidrug transporter EmrE-like cation transporter
MNLFKGILYGFVAQVLTFFQLQGQLKYPFFKEHWFLTACMGIPISLLFMWSVKHFVEFADGAIWPSRLIGFSIGIIVFSLMSYFLFKEPFTPKTIVCLILGLIIMGIQIFWK